MKRRDRILKTINHIEPDRIPIGFDIASEPKNEVFNYYGVNNLNELYQKTGIDCFSVWTWPAVLPKYIGPQIKGVNNIDSTYGFWGKVIQKQYPLHNKKLCVYRWPRADEFDYSSLEYELNQIKQHDITTASGHAGVGWLHHVQMRGYDKALYDVLDNSWMEEYMGRNKNFFIPYFKKLLKYAGGAIDIIRADEDLGGQENMLISPQLWRKWYKPLWQEVFNICHQHGVKIWMHSCGYCRPLIKDFIEIGVDILNPLPPYVRDSNPEDMKKEFGHKLTFDGGIDQLNVLTQGNPQMVAEEVKLRIQQLAPGGGYILGPSQVITKDIPFENIISLFENALKYGKY